MERWCLTNQSDDTDGHSVRLQMVCMTLALLPVSTCDKARKVDGINYIASPNVASN